MNEEGGEQDLGEEVLVLDNFWDEPAEVEFIGKAGQTRTPGDQNDRAGELGHELGHAFYHRFALLGAVQQGFIGCDFGEDGEGAVGALDDGGEGGLLQGGPGVTFSGAGFDPEELEGVQDGVGAEGLVCGVKLVQQVLGVDRLIIKLCEENGTREAGIGGGSVLRQVHAAICILCVIKKQAVFTEKML